MKISKKILSAVTAAAMLLTLTACNDGASSGQTGISGTSSDEDNLHLKITSANSTAANIRNRATDFIVRADTVKQSLRGTSKLAVIKCNVNGGKCDVSVSGGSDTVQFGSGDKVKWTGDDTENCFDYYLEDALNDSKPVYAEIYIKNGTVLGVVAVPDGNASDIPEALRDEGIWGKNGTGEINWQSGKTGVGANDVVIGTSPVIAQKQS